MSEKTIFGDDSMDFSDNLGDSITGAYTSYKNLYEEILESDAKDSGWRDFIKSVLYNDGNLGDVQNDQGSVMAKNFDQGSSSFPTEVREGEVLPKGIPVNPDSKADAAKQVQMQLGMALGSTKSEVPTTGNQEPESNNTEDENDANESDDSSSESHMEDAFMALTDYDGLGKAIMQKVRRAMVEQDQPLPDPSEIDLELEVTEKYDSLNEVPPETVATLSEEQISEIQA